MRIFIRIGIEFPKKYLKIQKYWKSKYFEIIFTKLNFNKKNFKLLIDIL